MKNLVLILLAISGPAHANLEGVISRIGYRHVVFGTSKEEKVSLEYSHRGDYYYHCNSTSPTFSIEDSQMCRIEESYFNHLRTLLEQNNGYLTCTFSEGYWKDCKLTVERKN